MPRAFGTDRLEPAPDGRWILTCRVSKEWRARRPGTPTSAEHPGTAVRWEESFFEVLSVERWSETGARYVLAAWDEVHVFRTVQDYSEPAEAQRAAVRREAAVRVKRRRISLLLAPLAGHLPAPVQEGLELAYNTPPAALTLISAVPLFLFGAFCVVWLTISSFAGVVGAGVGLPAKADSIFFIPMPVLLVGCFLFVESACRIVVALTQAQPLGSVAGAIAWELWRVLRRAPPPAAELATSVESEGPDPERVLFDAFRMREPLVSFLPAAEQRLFVERFDFDALRWGKTTAWAALAFAGLNALVSLGALKSRKAPAGEEIWLLASLTFAGEQVFRLSRLSAGEPAGSVLALLARPFVGWIARAAKTPSS